MMRQRLIRPAIRFGIAIGLILAFALAFKLITDEALSQEQRDEVLIRAIPFVAIFVSIILAYIYLIVALAITLNGKVPQRSYRPMEGLIIAGILLGVVALFQGWKMFVYEYGFLLLLGSAVAFIAWSHVLPMSARVSERLLPLPRRAHIIGLIAGGLVWAVLAGALIIDVKPQEPYEFRQQVWDLMMDDAEREAAREDANNEYLFNRIPVFVLLSLLPGALVYFGARELAAPGHPAEDVPEVPPTTGPAPVSELA